MKLKYKKMKLPELFLQKMKNLLGDEFNTFMESYKESPFYGLRLNPLKASEPPFAYLDKKIPWCKEGYYYPANEKPGKHPYHTAGAYYIQEPSAMAVVTQLSPQTGEKVLDLCAAPGGKSTAIAPLLGENGLLVSNEIVPSRAAILSQNIERLGITNTLVTNHSPDQLEKKFPMFFDRILVDAPCSGEGMFRKEPFVCEEWTSDSASICATRQQHILDSAVKMLKPNGVLCYSTCTFAPEENELTVESFLNHHPDFSLIPLPTGSLFQKGRPEWGNGLSALTLTCRLFPHRLNGEGHFIALFKRNSEASDPALLTEEKTLPSHLLYKDFVSQTFHSPVFMERHVVMGEKLYALPIGCPTLKGIKGLRFGLHLGNIKKNRFEPSHALLLALPKSAFKKTITFSPHDEILLKYLHGETIPTEEKGYVAVCVDQYPIGWGKGSDGILKNHFPKGLRLLM